MLSQFWLLKRIDYYENNPMQVYLGVSSIEHSLEHRTIKNESKMSLGIVKIQRALLGATGRSFHDILFLAFRWRQFTVCSHRCGN